MIISNLAGNKVIYGVRLSNMYVLQNSNIVAAIVTKGKTFFNQHKTLSYTNYNYIKILSNRINILNNKKSFCEPYIKDK